MNDWLCPIGQVPVQGVIGTSSAGVTTSYARFIRDHRGPRYIVTPASLLSAGVSRYDGLVQAGALRGKRGRLV